MKHVIIGDLHGRDVWKEAPPSRDGRIVFLGDYVDSFRFSDAEIKDNLLNMLAFKRANFKNVVLLIGNHDAQYLNYPLHRCVGFRPNAAADLNKIFSVNRDCFQFAYQSGNCLFTHAGLTNRWFNEFRVSRPYQYYKKKDEALAPTLNRIDWQTRGSKLYAPCRYRSYEDSNGGPVWADYEATVQDALDGYHQFVGHTAMEQPMSYVWPGKSITYLDVLHRLTYFHEIDV